MKDVIKVIDSYIQIILALIKLSIQFYIYYDNLSIYVEDNCND